MTPIVYTATQKIRPGFLPSLSETGLIKKSPMTLEIIKRDSMKAGRLAFEQYSSNWVTKVSSDPGAGLI